METAAGIIRTVLHRTTFPILPFLSSLCSRCPLSFHRPPTQKSHRPSLSSVTLCFRSHRPSRQQSQCFLLRGVYNDGETPRFLHLQTMACCVLESTFLPIASNSRTVRPVYFR